VDVEKNPSRKLLEFETLLSQATAVNGTETLTRGSNSPKFIFTQSCRRAHERMFCEFQQYIAANETQSQILPCCMRTVLNQAHIRIQI
jgi:hypothetical protein